MIAILTGDIINSEGHKASEWIDVLKKKLSEWGQHPSDWEIYRGDEFQVRIAPEEALRAGIQLKALIKSMKNLDVRMAIGLGSEDFKGIRVSESNGTAYQRSGRTFENLKADKRSLAITSGNDKKDRMLNLMLKLALDFMDEWTSVSAELVAIALENPDLSQQEIAQQLHIQQSAVSQRQKRARLDLVFDVLHFYSETVKSMEP
ncbi:MAG: hypothetical protein Mars2KO_08410 [Maribacter sp.]|uniref:SatD family protein n=1 Tax=Maribacter sp. 2307UL18-2 TaxID=3386274 RepID=UPI0039BD141D